MKIAIIPSWYPNNYQPHLGTFIREQYKILRAMELDVSLIGAIPISARYGLRPRSDENSDTQFLKFFTSLPGLRYWGALESRRRGLELFKKYVEVSGKPEVLHVHSYLQGFLILAIHQKYNIPYVVTEHYTRLLDLKNLANWERKLCRDLYSKSSANYAVSEYYAKILAENFDVRFDVMPNYIDFNKFALPQLDSKDNDFRILSVGGLTKRKGLDIILKSVAILKKEGMNISLEIIGSGIEESNLKKLCSELGLNQKVEFIPYVPNDELPLHMQNADCFVLASDFETFGVVVIEALACGTPAVVTAEAPQMFIKDGFNGYTAQRDPKSLAKSIKKCLKIEVNRDDIREDVEQKYSPEVVTQHLLKEYQRILR